VGPRAGLDNVQKRKYLTLPGLELRPIGRPARSQSLYRLSYSGFVANSTLYGTRVHERPPSQETEVSLSTIFSLSAATFTFYVTLYALWPQVPVKDKALHEFHAYSFRLYLRSYLRLQFSFYRYVLPTTGNM
jgi:hypothetical protein